jgi:hypothetical protein
MYTLVPPVSTPPRPSPSHHTASDHTIDAPRASRTVGRQKRPRASASWMRANPVLKRTMWWARRFEDQVMGPAITDGLPAALDPSASVANALVNMYGWNCRAASRSHTAPSRIWNVRRRVASLDTARTRATGRR